MDTRDLSFLVPSSDILEAIPEALIVVESDGKILFINQQAESLFGHRRSTLLDQNIEVLMPMRFRDRHTSLRNNYTANPKTRAMGSNLVLFGLKADGTEFPIEVSLSPLKTAKGYITLAAIRDISIHKNLEDQLKLKNDYLKKIDIAKDLFIAGMSHELRTPLNIIIGFSGILLMQSLGSLNADQQNQVNKIESSARYLLSIINDMLDIAKIEAETIELDYSEINCNEIIDELVKNIKPLLKFDTVTLLDNTPPEAIKLTTDKRILTQILINLLNNSVKFTVKGTIEISAREKADKLDYIIFDIIDTGIGINEVDKDKVFKAFKRIETPGFHKEGAGLGLYLCNKLAILLNGRIEFESEFGKGSRFSLILPKFPSKLPI